MLAYSQTFVQRHREEVAVLVSSAAFLTAAFSLVWILTLRI